ncbi:MAG: hypothetical protein MJ180_01960 [Candidatus Gastranaerophilales bacterium]|nr:hypothetical protein [Candidatus Gastranaerophilales bacterium]
MIINAISNITPAKVLYNKKSFKHNTLTFKGDYGSFMQTYDLYCKPNTAVDEQMLYDAYLELDTEAKNEVFRYFASQTDPSYAYRLQYEAEEWAKVKEKRGW